MSLMDTSFLPPKYGPSVVGIRNNMGRLPGSQFNPCQVRTQVQPKHLTSLCLANRRFQAHPAQRFQRISRNPFPMTIELQGPRAKISGSMDNFVPSPEFYRDGDHTLPGADIAAYAASPNSLYMYEQEKHDMQNTINGALCNPSSSTFTTPKEDFDLKPQYELNSLDLSIAESLVNSATNQSPASQWIKSENIFDSDMSSDTIFQLDNSNMSTGPTLAELNMDESLIDEVVSLVNAESAYATSTGSVLGSKGDNSRSLSVLRSVQPASLTQSVSELKAMLPKHTLQSTSLATSSAMQSGLPSWTVCNSQAKVPSSTNVSASVQSTVPMSSVSTNFQSVAKPLPNFSRDDKPTLHKLLLRKSMLPQPQPMSNNTAPPAGVKRTATVAKLEAVEEKWKEIEKYIHEPTEENKSSTSSSSKRSRHESENSTQPSNYDPESDNDVFSDRDSDLDDDLSDEEGMLSQFDEGVGSGKRKDRQYFWQYNVQSKGPKGTRLRLELDQSNPHELKHFEDPVFNPSNTQVAGIRHGGKARKGDGNDVHPNPKRLVQIGMQIKRLNRKINEVTSLGESTASARNQSRKEKNKLASRACRLKKKAQHEANKVKLFGLEKEHKQLMDVMVSIRASLKKHLLEQVETRKESLVDRLENLIETYLKAMIAGHTTDYVNKVIANYEKGDPTGGLDIRRK